MQTFAADIKSILDKITFSTVKELEKFHEELAHYSVDKSNLKKICSCGCKQEEELKQFHSYFKLIPLLKECYSQKYCAKSKAKTLANKKVWDWICVECKTKKDPEEFYNDKDNKPKKMCKKCVCEYQKKRRDINKKRSAELKAKEFKN